MVAIDYQMVAIDYQMVAIDYQTVAVDCHMWSLVSVPVTYVGEALYIAAF